MTVPPSEKIYVIEAGGVVILAFAATSHREAQSLLREEWLKADLRELHVGGKPVWDGATKLTIRHASARSSESPGAAFAPAA